MIRDHRSGDDRGARALSDPEPAGRPDPADAEGLGGQPPRSDQRMPDWAARVTAHRLAYEAVHRGRSWEPNHDCQTCQKARDYYLERL